jgi:phosphoribosyl-AMP cyclohydrolase
MPFGERLDRVSALDPDIASRLKLDANGLITAVVQDAASHDVLMVGWMDPEALRRTLDSKRATFWSRSRQEYWTKGETSGNFLEVTEVRLDCDGDTVLVIANPAGPTCHTGARTCFDNDQLP